MLQIENVTVRFGGVTALDNFSATVGDGEICGFIGPNGAGKTTLFNCCTRIVRPTDGRITFDGSDLLSAAPHQVVRLGVARTFQNLALFPTMTVLDNTLVGAHSRSRVSFAQALVGWPPNLGCCCSTSRPVVSPTPRSTSWAS
jgi:branched-chain amino acid transport system ATP-binding protein